MSDTEALSPFGLSGKTALVVSHDERYFHLADKVVKFESGTVVSIERNTLPNATSPAFSAVLDV